MGKDGLGSAAVSIGEALLALDAFKWSITALDAYGRLDSAMTISQHLPAFFSSLWFTPLTLLLGFILILMYVQKRTAEQQQQSRIVDHEGNPLPPRYDWKWLWVTLAVLLVASSAALFYDVVRVMNYKAPYVKVDNSPPIPPPVAYERPTLLPRVVQLRPPSPAVSAPYGIAIGSGATAVNPTVNNVVGAPPIDPATFTYDVGKTVDNRDHPYLLTITIRSSVPVSRPMFAFLCDQGIRDFTAGASTGYTVEGQIDGLHYKGIPDDNLKTLGIGQPDPVLATDYIGVSIRTDSAADCKVYLLTNNPNRITEIRRAQ